MQIALNFEIVIIYVRLTGISLTHHRCSMDTDKANLRNGLQCLATVQQRHNQTLAENIELHRRLTRLENDFAILSYKYADLEMRYADCMDQLRLGMHTTSDVVKLAKKPKERRYECFVCKSALVNAAALRKHMRNVCGRTSTTHSSEKSAKRTHSCALCGRIYSSKACARSHYIKNSCGGSFPCRFCGQTFMFKCIFERHRRTEHGIYVCQYPGCGRTYTAQTSQHRHELTHTADRGHCDAGPSAVAADFVPVKCESHQASAVDIMDTIETVVNNSSAIVEAVTNGHDDRVVNRVKWQHTNGSEGLHKCDQCQATYNYKYELRAHQQLHTPNAVSRKIFKNMKRYKCNTPGCNKTFSRRDFLSHHKRIHAEYQSFVCHHVGCSKSYSYKRDLNKHLATAHVDVDSLVAVDASLDESLQCHSIAAIFAG